MRRRQRRERHRGAAPDPGGGNNSPRPPCFALRRCRAAGFGGRPCAWFQKRRGKGGVFARPEVSADAFRAAAPACGGRPTFPRSGNVGVVGRDFRMRESCADVFQGKSVLLFQAFSLEKDVFSACFAAGNFCLPRNDVYQRSKNAADHQAARQTSLGRRIYSRRQGRRMSCKPCLPYGVSGAEGPARLIKVSGRERGNGGRRPPFSKGGLLPPQNFLLSLLTSLRGCRRRSSARCCLYGRCAWGSRSLR